MVPCNGDVEMEKRKAEEDVTSDGKKKRQKKNQASTRPACSWVYFSREFIKEYSASHPESSGLKAATKAASEAWKSMGLEEKAKYTRRAREVWDDYLSSAPARTPKPRKQTKLVTRCSPGRLFNVLQRLTPEQKSAVKSMGFGSLLTLRCRTLRRSLCLWLLERFNTTRRSLDICDEHIPLSPHDVEQVMGLAADGKDVVNSGPDDLIADLRHSYNATNHGISVRLLEERLGVPEAGEDFKRSFILYALGTVLSPTARLDVSPSFLHFLTNMNVVHQFNWGKFLLDRLVREVSRFRQGKQRAVGGCLLFLQLFYYESISVERPGSSAAPITTPCLSSWGEEEITEREKTERELGGYGFGEVICKARCLSKQSSEYIDQLDALSAGDIDTAIEDGTVLEQQYEPPVSIGIDGDIMMDEETIPILKICRNKDYGCNETTNHNEHDQTCACPVPGCNFTSSSTQLSLHFSGKHWESGRRFQYNAPLSVSLSASEHFLILQAEEDGALFLLNKGVEAIGYTAMITRLGPSASKERFVYDIASGKGISSLRLKSSTQSFPGRVVGFPPMDFLLVPFHFCGSGEVNLEICIWSLVNIGENCS